MKPTLTPLQSKELKANFIGNNKSLLLKRLKESLSVMNNNGKKLFKNYSFDFPNKRLISHCKHFSLQWQLRKYPNKPENPLNQQTSSGSTCVNLL